MKKLLSVMAAMLLLCSLLLLPALANNYTPCVRDDAWLLFSSEAEELESEARRISEKYGCAVYIVTVRDYRDYGTTVEEAAENIYYEEELGINGNCVMLLLSMNDRDYDIMAHGTIGNGAFTDYGKDLLAEHFLDNFRNDDWAGGFRDYVAAAERFLEAEASGNPIDTRVESRPEDFSDEPVVSEDSGYYEESKGRSVSVWPFALGGGGAGLLGTGIASRKMKSVRKKRTAGNYVVHPGAVFTRRDDYYTHTTRVQRRIESENHDSGGGTSVNSGGFSHSSGKF